MRKIKIRVPNMSTLKEYRYYYFDFEITNNVWQKVVSHLFKNKCLVINSSVLNNTRIQKEK